MKNLVIVRMTEIKNKVIGNNPFKKFNLIKDNRVVYILATIFIIGVLLGCNLVYYFDEESKNIFFNITNKITNSMKNENINENFYNLVLSSSFYIITLFFCGFCIIAQPIIFICPLIKGLGIGISEIAILCKIKSAIDFGVFLISISIDIIIVIIMLFACKQSFNLSKTIISFNNDNLKKLNIRSYIIKYIAYFIITMFLCALKTVIFYYYSQIL